MARPLMAASRIRAAMPAGLLLGARHLLDAAPPIWMMQPYKCGFRFTNLFVRNGDYYQLPYLLIIPIFGRALIPLQR